MRVEYGALATAEARERSEIAEAEFTSAKERYDQALEEISAAYAENQALYASRQG